MSELQERAKPSRTAIPPGTVLDRPHLKHPHIGSSLDTLLAADGTLDEVRTVARNRVMRRRLVLVALLTGPIGGFLLGFPLGSLRGRTATGAPQPVSQQYAKRKDGQTTTLRLYGWGLQGYGDMLLSMDDARAGQKIRPLWGDEARHLEELARDLRTIAQVAEDTVLMDRTAKTVGKP